MPPLATNDGEETIAAICGGPGAALSSIRISGPDALACAKRAWFPKAKKASLEGEPRRMILGEAPCPGGEEVLAVYMPGPKSYTGEDVVELHCHGGSAAPKRLLEAVLRYGARPAEAGEFTRRAFLNGRMDLTQAEAVAELIASKSASALALAEKQAGGALGRAVKALREPLIAILTDIEARLDFPEEEIPWRSNEELDAELAALLDALRKLQASRRDGAVLREGVRLVIAGRPNVGKSSLLNALLGFDRAIVSATPGTTRDTIEEFATLNGVPVRLTDTAGIRSSEDEIETQGVERSLKSLSGAEAILWLLDASAKEPAQELAQMKEKLPGGPIAIAVWNKSDLAQDLAKLPESGLPTAFVSAKTGRGLKELGELFAKCVWGSESHTEPELAVSTRHAKLLEEAEPLLEEARQQVERSCWELAAASLREALEKLGAITGETATPDVLDSIFKNFCIGK